MQSFYPFMLTVPEDFSELVAVKLLWTAAGGGNMYWRLTAEYGADGEALAEHGQTTLAYGATASGGAYVLNVQEPGTPLTLSSLEHGDLLAIRVQRYATNALDTVNADVFLFGLLFIYEAD